MFPIKNKGSLQNKKQEKASHTKPFQSVGVWPASRPSSPPLSVSVGVADTSSEAPEIFCFKFLGNLNLQAFMNQ